MARSASRPEGSSPNGRNAWLPRVGTASVRLDHELSAAVARSDGGACSPRGRRALCAFRAVACRGESRLAPRPQSRHHEPSRPPRAVVRGPRDPAQTARAAAAAWHPAPPAHSLLKLSGVPRIALSRQLALEFGALGARLLLGTVSTVDRVLRARRPARRAAPRACPGARRARCPPACGARPRRPVVDFYGRWAAARADAFADN
jgi:hypothetical protein